MASKLKKFEFKARVVQGKYSWDAWLDGDIWRLVQADDFPDVGDIDHMPPKIKTAARRRYKVCKVQLDREAMTLVLQASPMTDEQRVAEDKRRVDAKAKDKAKNSDDVDDIVDEA